MDGKKLEILMTAIDLGSFSKASEVVGYTQSGLTHLVDSMEREIGFPIISRSHSGIGLTPQGEELMPAIRSFLKANARLENQITAISESKKQTIRIAAYASIAMQWMPEILYRFRRSCPDANVDLRMVDNALEPFELLEAGKTDVIFASRQEFGQYDWIHLKDDKMFAVLPPNFDVGEKRSFSITDFDAQEFIMPSQGFGIDILRVFDQQEIHPNIRPTMVDDATVVSMVEHGLGISMMTELTLRGRTNNIKLLPVEPTAYRDLGIAVRSANAATAHLQKFIACAKRMVAEL